MSRCTLSSHCLLFALVHFDLWLTCQTFMPIFSTIVDSLVGIYFAFFFVFRSQFVFLCFACHWKFNFPILRWIHSTSRHSCRVVCACIFCTCSKEFRNPKFNQSISFHDDSSVLITWRTSLYHSYCHFYNNHVCDENCARAKSRWEWEVTAATAAGTASVVVIVIFVVVRLNLDHL